MKVYVMIANGSEEVETLTVVDLLRRADIDTYLVSVEDSKEIIGSHNIKITADHLFKELNEIKGSIILPGGMKGATTFSNDKRLIDELSKALKEERLVGAICASSSIVLGKNKLIQKRKVTCYPGLESNLEDNIYLEDDVVVDGNLITSRGPATSIKFALEIIKYLKGNEVKEQIKNDILAK